MPFKKVKKDGKTMYKKGDKYYTPAQVKAYYAKTKSKEHVGPFWDALLDEITERVLEFGAPYGGPFVYEGRHYILHVSDTGWKLDPA